MGDPDEVGEFRFRHSFNASHLRRLQCATEEDAEFKGVPFGAYEEVAGLSRKHDRLVGGINPLFPEFRSCFAKALPRFQQISGEVPGKRSLGGGPAIVLFTLLDCLFAVITNPVRHFMIVAEISCRRIRLGQPAATAMSRVIKNREIILKNIYREKDLIDNNCARRHNAR